MQARKPELAIRMFQGEYVALRWPNLDSCSRDHVLPVDAGLTNDAVRLARSHAPHLVAEIMLSATAPPSLPSPVNNTAPAFNRACSTASVMASAGTGAGAKAEQKLQLIMMQVSTDNRSFSDCLMSESHLPISASYAHLFPVCRLSLWRLSGISPAPSASILRYAHNDALMTDVSHSGCSVVRR